MTFINTAENFFETETGRKLIESVHQQNEGLLIVWSTKDILQGETWVIRKVPSSDSQRKAILDGFQALADTEWKKEKLNQIVSELYIRQKPESMTGAFTSLLEDLMYRNLTKEIECSCIEYVAPIYEALNIPYKSTNIYKSAFDRIFDDKGVMKKEAEPRIVIIRELVSGVVEKRLKGNPGIKPTIVRADFTRIVRKMNKPTKAKVSEELGCSERALTEWCKRFFPSSDGKHFKRAVEDCRKYDLSS